MIKAVIFDLGDTVLYSDWKKRNEAMLKETGVSINLDNKIKTLYNEVSKGKKELRDLFAKIIKEEGIKVDIDFVMERYRINYEKYSSVNQEIIRIIENIRKKVKVYALSNTNKVHKEINEKRNVFKHFDACFLSCDLGLIKNDIEIFNFVVKEINFLPNEVLFIDDNMGNVNNAIKIGMQGLQYTSLDDLKSKLKIFKLL